MIRDYKTREPRAMGPVATFIVNALCVAVWLLACVMFAMGV